MAFIGVGRISSQQRYDKGAGYVLGNQNTYAEHTLRMNTGQRLLTNYDQIDGAKKLVGVTGRIVHRDQLVENYAKAATELDLSDASLANIKNILDEIKADALQGSNDSLGPKDLVILGNQLRNLGENIYQLANTKLGNKYLFSNLQTDVKTITFTPGDLFANAVYKEGNADIGERFVDSLQSSVNLTDMFNTNASPAIAQGAAVGALAANSEINIVVNDGTQDINVGNVALAAGDTVAVMVTKINTAFNAAGGLGAIAQDGGGFLEFDTSLITGSVDNANAAVIISPGTTLPATLANTGHVAGTTRGVSKDLRQTLSELDSAYYSGDNQRVRDSLVDIEENLDRLNDAQAILGDLVSKFNDAVSRNQLISEQNQVEQSDIARLPVVEAIEKVSEAQNVLSATLQSSAAVMRQSVFQFLRL